MDIRSYRAVFELERRVYRVDSIRLNPGGIPLRGLLYAAALILFTLLADRLQPVGFLLGPLPWYVRFLGLPIALAGLATVVRIEARPFHLALWSIIAHRLGPAHTRGLTRSQAPGARWHAGPVLLIVDGSDARLRRLRYRGPGAVLVCCGHDRVEWPRPLLGSRRRGADVTLHAASDARPLGRPTALELAAGGVIETTARPLA